MSSVLRRRHNRKKVDPYTMPLVPVEPSSAAPAPPGTH